MMKLKPAPLIRLTRNLLPVHGKVVAQGGTPEQSLARITTQPCHGKPDHFMSATFTLPY